MSVADSEVKVILSGGPAEMATDGSVPAGELDRTLKIRYRGGHEHFVHDGEYQTIDGCDAAVFRWTGRTKIAE